MDFGEDDDGLNYDKDTPMVGFFSMFRFSTCKIKVYLVLGIISAILAGFAMPLFVIFIEELYNSFDPDTTVETTYGKIVTNLKCPKSGPGVGYLHFNKCWGNLVAYLLPFCSFILLCLLGIL